ncbi:MAG: thioredoxin-disulfide reductase [Succinivibrio sp.]
MSQNILNTVIIGSGPAGLTAAIYACRANLKPVLIEGMLQGGQLTTTPEIENWPSRHDKPSGFDLIEDMKKHASMLGTEFISDTVTGVSLNGDVKEVVLSSGKILKTRTVIICTGANAKYLGLDSENEYKGRGVSACATCDGFFYRNKDVAVIGGGSAAFVEALYLSEICSKVYLVHRRTVFRAESVLVEKIKEKVNDGKVELVLDSNVTEVIGDGNSVTGITVDSNGVKRTIPLSGVFVAIGHSPATQIFKDQLELDEDGTIKTGFTTQTSTSVQGVFAAGDCADNLYRQAITSAGQGCKAALDAERYLLGRL